MSTRNQLNQQRLPVQPAVPVTPTEVVVTSTVSAATTEGPADATVTLVRDTDVVEAIERLTLHVDALTQLISAIFAE